VRQYRGMEVTARVDYALRALLALAAASPERLTRDDISSSQGVPPRYLEDILVVLRQAGLVEAQRGNAGGYRLSRAADLITVADVARAVDGPLALVHGQRPETVVYFPPSQHLGELWVGLRAAIRSVMEQVTLANLLADQLPPVLRDLVADPDAWRIR
jgi:Rrf2 family protein